MPSDREDETRTVEFEISDQDLVVVMEDLVNADRFQSYVWMALDVERDRRAAGAGVMPIRLLREEAIVLAEFLDQCATGRASSSDVDRRQTAAICARVAVSVRAALDRPPHRA